MKFEDIYTENYKYVLNVVSRFSNSYQEAEDLTQDVFVLAWRHFDGFRGESAVRTWLHQIARNHCINHMTKKGRRIQADNVDDEIVVPQYENPATIYEKDEEAEKIVTTLNEMPEAMRNCLIGCDLEGLNYSEIAEREGIPTGTVRSRIHRARALLQ